MIRRALSHIWDWLVIFGGDLLLILLIIGVVVLVQMAHWIF